MSKLRSGMLKIVSEGVSVHPKSNKILFKHDLFDQLLQLFKDSVERVIGEDDHVTYLKDTKYRECPTCQTQEESFHKAGCGTLLEVCRNYLRQEQRQSLIKEL